MDTPSPCFICVKHARLSDYTGPILAEADGLMLTHFPIQNGVPATQGHLLIEPRRHITDLGDLTEAEARTLGTMISQGSRLIREKLGAEHVYVFRINDLVPHLHFHLVPRYPGTPREVWGPKIMEWAGAPKVTLEEVRTLRF